ncbi:hypothetical protein LTR81_004589 [Elasticomyces elasticus]
MATNPIVRPGLFFTLPPEIRDMIFELAYPATRPKIIFKREWQREQDREYKRDRANYVTETFPTPKVSEFMVSKEFFVGAARAYMGAQDWQTDDVRGFVWGHHGIFYKFARYASVNLIGCVTELSDCRRLKSLTVDISVYAFEDMRPGLHVWEDVCSDSDFEGLETTSDLLELRRATSLTSLKITAEHGSHYFANTAAKEQMWQDNVRRYQDYLWKNIEEKREDCTKRTNRPEEPLYWWSRVCFDTHDLRPDPKLKVDTKEQITGPLHDSDVPEDEHELLDMVKQRGADVVAWVRAKKANAEPTEEWFEAVEEVAVEEQ